jgi:hypothetical protein
MSRAELAVHAGIKGKHSITAWLKQRRDWAVREEGPVTLWEIPANALVLLSHTGTHKRPILHSEAITPAGQTPEKRTILVYDAKL